MLAHFLEEEGLATTQISLIRLHTDVIKPPRALWVPFELGRPLGEPNNPAFQKRVLMSALGLLEAPRGPLLIDFPDDTPLLGGAPVMLACPYVPPAEDAETTQADRLCKTFKTEMTSMRPWYDQALKKRGRTIVGISKLTPEAIADFLCSFLEGSTPTQNPRQDVSLAYQLGYSVEDLKAYYYEAITAQPGADVLSSEDLDKWFWENTVAGKFLRELRGICLKNEDKLLQQTAARRIIPQKTLLTNTGGKG
ncbi:MAG: hypothetical protein KGZ63_14150 [Clostridiales bacterium]|nr:hypothetical protein [Clostridiales bacterium]